MLILDEPICPKIAKSCLFYSLRIAMIINISANMLGLDNAASPGDLEAMKDL